MVLHLSERWGLPAYPTMFVSIALLITAMASVYVWPAFTAPRHLQQLSPARIIGHSSPNGIRR